ncbi:hypothetical protein DNTS_030223, partial [Danionella cerebrum]
HCAEHAQSAVTPRGIMGFVVFGLFLVFDFGSESRIKSSDVNVIRESLQRRSPLFRRKARSDSGDPSEQKISFLSMSVSDSPIRPITAVSWASNASLCPSHFTLISLSEDGDISGGMVVADIQVISDKETIPHGYCFIPEYLEHKASVGKKKRICVRIVPAASVSSAVLDLKLSAKNRTVVQQYTCLGEMNGFVLWCLKGSFSSPAPQAKPRRISLDMLLPEVQSPPLRPSNGPEAPLKISGRRSKLQQPAETSCDGANHSSVCSTAMDGVPFALHPRFESQRSASKGCVSSLGDIQIKSMQDIENEYSYTFSVEEQAAKRNRPSVTG